MFLAVVIWITALLVAASFAIRRWWFPAPISAHAATFDSIFSVNLIVMGAIFFVAQVLLAWLIWKHRDRGQKAQHSEGSTRLELVWTSLTLVLFLGAGFASTGLWYDAHLSALSDADLRIEVASKQFAWSFRYPGADGKFGKTDVKLVNDASGNPFGIVENDTAGKDDIVGSALRIPAGRPVRLLLQSLLLGVGAYLAIAQEISPGSMIAASVLGGRALSPVDQIIAGWR
ncbi:MAG: hypothetical protein JNL62_07020, partial [Bryobacterales bacterium]|nr:hypothetical protein [Bryobacterales bacterium]